MECKVLPMHLVIISHLLKHDLFIFGIYILDWISILFWWLLRKFVLGMYSKNTPLSSNNISGQGTLLQVRSLTLFLSFTSWSFTWFINFFLKLWIKQAGLLMLKPKHHSCGCPLILIIIVDYFSMITDILHTLVRISGACYAFILILLCLC